MMPTPLTARAPAVRAVPTAGTTPAVGGSARLERLKSAPRKPGEASFFFWDAHFRNDAVKVLPGEYFVHDEDLLITTTLGSCIAACLWDRERRIGGMNHFMLPEGSGDSGRYGSYAMELLINELMKKGASRLTLEAKIFGGGAVIGGMSSINVGERNIEQGWTQIDKHGFQLEGVDVGDHVPRTVTLVPAVRPNASVMVVVTRIGDRSPAGPAT